jgi:EAL domain-containing protein (putative c-di-GMP-specific phosphodiesterase class I)/DNA-binding NarL/FixJ family response regulator
MSNEPEPACRVLLIDDDPAVCRDYARVLRRFNVGIETATNGRTALERVVPGSFDAMLVDIAMPGLDGIGVLRAIRDRDPDPPVVLMTGDPTLSTALKAIEYGAAHYLLKPVDSDTLAEAVWRAVDLGGTMRRLRASALAGRGSDFEAARNAALGEALDEALSASWMAFQPIVHAPDREVFAYEALVRSDSALLGPAELFDAADRVQRAHDLGRTIRRKVAEAASAARSDTLLFVNVHASELNDNELLSADAPLSKIAERVVLELTERSAIHQVAGLETRLARLRTRGFRIALDDLGQGYAGLAGLLQLQPDFVKLDMSLVRGIDRSSRQQSLARGIARICSRDLGILVVGEGVERPEERDVLIANGLDLQQGYLFARPAAGFPAPRW